MHSALDAPATDAAAAAISRHVATGYGQVNRPPGAM